MAGLDEIRVAEARRMLGLERADDLADRARRWLVAGVDAPSIRMLADGSERTVDQSLRLLRSAAVELDITFASMQAARTYFVQWAMPDMLTPGSSTGATTLYDVSNGFTDELTSRARKTLGRLFRRPSR